jgi:hypothetical protein
LASAWPRSLPAATGHRQPDQRKRLPRVKSQAQTVERHKVAAWMLPWLRSRWRSWHRRANLGCQAANAGPTGGGSACTGGPPCGRGDRGCPSAFRAVRPFPVRVATGSPWRARVEWTVSGRTCGVRKAVRSWRPSWTPDTTARTSDGDQACGRSGIEHGCRWSRRTGPDAGSGWGWPKGACALPSCPVRDVDAAWLAVAGWPEAWSVAGRWRCPPLRRRRPDGVCTHRLGGHIELGVSGRPDGRGVRHVRRPASHCRVSQRN